MYDPNELELEILKFWEKNQIFDKLRKKNSKNKPWSFIDGPITANNKMGIHHVWGRTIKDVYQRFKAMQGFDQRWQNGFDCQGLWVEVEAEKDLKLKNKKDIEKYGPEKFSKYCKERVYKFTKILTEQSIRLGQWNDWDNSYYTMDDNNIEHIWLFLKKCHDKKWLFKGHKVQPWCSRCGTSVSHHEMIESYEELTHTSLYLKFPIKGKENEFLLVWTTTPWTLTSNVAAAVHPDLDYVKVKKDNEILYLSKQTTSCLGKDFKELETLKGKKLVGLEYEGPFDYLDAQKGIKHKVIAWDLAGEEEGTGIVHIAPGCGAEDFELGKKENLEAISPLDENGYFIENFNQFTGKNVKETKEMIIEDLGKRNFLFKTTDYAHRYPTCWRCKEELVFRLVDSWFIKVDEIRPLMKKAAEKVHWQPEHAGKLMQNWLDSMSDWSISRKRYWGLPLPIWICPEGHETFVSSKEELKKLATSGFDKLKELHKPWIDDVKIKCPKCNQEATRIPELGDCWLDAGIIPYSTLKYVQDNVYWKKWFPAELVVEMREQIRLWFYSLLFISIALENKAPYKTVLIHEKVNDELGRPMHKSWGNAVWFNEAVEKVGADILRWQYSVHNLTTNVNFGYTESKEIQRTLTMLFNLCNYLSQSSEGKPKTPRKFEAEDDWILSKLNKLVKESTHNLETFNPNTTATLIQEFFITDLSRGYIQLIRDRVQDEDGHNKQAAVYCLYKSIYTVVQLMAPYVPFLTEHIYQKHFKEIEKKESIHLTNWPKADPKKINKKLETLFESAFLVIEKGLAEREKIGLGVKWPLSLAEVRVIDTLGSTENLKEVIKKKLNVKKIDIKKGKEFTVVFDQEVTPELEQEGFAREIIRRAQQMRKKAELQKQDKIELSVVSDYSLKEWTGEIQKTTNSKLMFEDKKFKESKEYDIKGKKFKISIKIL